MPLLRNKQEKIYIPVTIKIIEKMIVKEEFLSRLRKIFDLNLYEVKVWTALLSRGVSTAGELSNISDVPRSRTYDILESLEKKGFIVMKLGKPIKFVALKPEEVIERVKRNLVVHAKEKTKRLEELKTDDVLHEINTLFTQGIKFVEPSDLSGSIRGRNNMYNHLDMLIGGSEKNITIVTTADGLNRKLETLLPSLEKAKKRGVKIRIAAPITPKNEKIAKDISKIAEVRNMKNFNGRFSGNVTMQYALEKSLNIPAIKTLDRVGIPSVINMARKLGIKSHLEPALSLALGASEVTMLEITSAFGVFANEGIRYEPTAITKIVDRNGNTIFISDEKGEQVIDSNVANIIAFIASAFLAVVLNESDRDWVINKTLGRKIVSPEILPYEIGNALIAVRKRGSLNDREVLKAYDISQRIAVKLVPVKIHDAIKIALRFSIYAYDAYYLQCCVENKLPLISLDDRMCDAARNLSIKVVE